DVLANDPDIGRRDTDRDSIPDIAYVTGTGAHDIITLTSGGMDTVDVQVDAYDDAAHTGLIRSHSYTIDLTSDTEGEIRIDGSINDDDIIIDADIAASFNVLGHLGNDRVFLRGQATRAIQGLTFTGEDGDDSLIVDYTNGIALPDSGITFDAGDMGNDSILLTGGTVTDSDYVFVNATDGTIALDGRVITYTGLDPITDDMGVVNRTFTFSDMTETVTLEDNGTAGDGISRISSVSDDMVPVPLSETVDFSAPTGSLTVNMGDGDDSLDFVALDSLFAASLAVNGDDGDDEIDGSTLTQAAFLSGSDGADTVTGSDFDDSLSGGTGDDELDGGMGTDTLVETADADLTLTNTSLAGLGTDMLTSIEQAFLTGGASANILDASAFTTGSVTLLGGDGDDELLGGTNGDSLDGEAGDDTLRGNAGSDTLVAGDGSDSVLGGDDADMITVTFAGGIVDVDAGDGADLIEVRDSGADVMGTVTIDAGLGSDLILTVPLLNGTLSIDGNVPVFPGAPPAADLLTISLIGTGIADEIIINNVTGGVMDDGTGSVTSSTHGDITFTSIEALNLYAGPDLVFDADQAVPFGGDGKNTGGGDVDDFRIIRNGTLGELSVDGLLFAIFPVDVVNSITVDGSTDDDLFEIDEMGGQLPFTILYNGLESAGDNDALRVTGGPGVDTGVYIPSSTTNGDGTITLAGQTISFTGLEPVEVT
ncbi:MAG: calcium-binding protein, partial [Planctomycetaceae bacterium]